MKETNSQMDFLVKGRFHIFLKFK